MLPNFCFAGSGTEAKIFSSCRLVCGDKRNKTNLIGEMTSPNFTIVCQFISAFNGRLRESWHSIREAFVQAEVASSISHYAFKSANYLFQRCVSAYHSVPHHYKIPQVFFRPNRLQKSLTHDTISRRRKKENERRNDREREETAGFVWASFSSFGLSASTSSGAVLVGFSN